MHSLRKRKKVLAMVMAVLFATPALAGIATDPKNPKNDDLDVEVYDEFSQSSFDTTTIKIYDHQDNLVYENTLMADEVPSLDLLKLLNKSDFLVDDNTTSYFRLND